MSNPIVTIEMENGGVIRAELYRKLHRTRFATLFLWCRRAFMTARSSIVLSRAL